MEAIDIKSQPGQVLVTIKARSAKELFEKSGRALFMVMAGEDNSESATHEHEDFRQTVAVSAVDQVSLMIDWLTELIGLADLESVIADHISISTIDDTSLVATLEGYHEKTVIQPVSAINYESVKISETDIGLEATFALET